MARTKKKRQLSEAKKEERKEKREAHAALLKQLKIEHFARSHQNCAKDGTRLCNNYGDLDTIRAKPPSMAFESEAAVHHILPVSAVVGFMKEQFTPQELTNITSTYAAMNWCINLDDNLYWLPYFPAYGRHLAAGTPGQAPKEAAHNFDHPTYTEQVKNRLKPLWREIASQTEDETKECKKKERMVQTLNSAIGSFRSGLINKDTHGTLETAIELKKDGAKKSKREEDLGEWWKEFSMWPDAAKVRDVNLLFPRALSQKMKDAITRRLAAL